MQITSDLKKCAPDASHRIPKSDQRVSQFTMQQTIESVGRIETKTLGVNRPDTMCKILHPKKSLIVTFLGVQLDGLDLNDHPINYVDGIITQSCAGFVARFAKSAFYTIVKTSNL